jgi:hypothetical protein
MDSNTYSISEDEIKFEVERLKKEELEQKVKQELTEYEIVEENKKKFLKNFFENNGFFNCGESLINLKYDLEDTFKDFENHKNFEKIFWENLEQYGGFSKCPTCKKEPYVLRIYQGTEDYRLFGSLIGVTMSLGLNKMNKERPRYTSGLIKSIQCCEHLFDFQQKKRYIKLANTPFKNNPLIETTKYASIFLLNGKLSLFTKDINRIQNPKEWNDYINWEEYIPYIETFKTQETSSEENEAKKIAKELNISKQKKEIQILEQLLSEAREKLKALEVV